jgi:predicted SprT family Zn-dependent metalloprotease
MMLHYGLWKLITTYTNDDEDDDDYDVYWNKLQRKVSQNPFSARTIQTSQYGISRRKKSIYTMHCQVCDTYVYDLKDTNICVLSSIVTHLRI